VKIFKPIIIINKSTLLTDLKLLHTEQDRGLDALSSIIQRQKMIGHAISDEVDAQNGKYTSNMVGGMVQNSRK